MKRKGKPNIFGFLRQTKGAVAVEFAIMGTLFLLLIGGILDFGHAWYMKQTITNASREGARYGITYKTNDSGTRIAPSNITSPYTIQGCILNYLSPNGLNLLPSDANPTVTLAGTGLTTGTKGLPLEVTVTATKHWFMVSSFVPGMDQQKIIIAQTVMLCE